MAFFSYNSHYFIIYITYFIATIWFVESIIACILLPLSLQHYFQFLCNLYYNTFFTVNFLLTCTFFFHSVFHCTGIHFLPRVPEEYPPSIFENKTSSSRWQMLLHLPSFCVWREEDYHVAVLAVHLFPRGGLSCWLDDTYEGFLRSWWAFKSIHQGMFMYVCMYTIVYIYVCR